MQISTELLVAINSLCSGSEVKVLLAVLAHDSNKMSAAQMQKVTGITKPNNYFRIRKKLLDLGYLIMDDNCMHVNTDKIIADYTNMTS